MTRGKNFQYALQPVLLTRQWALDDLLLELKEAKQQLQEAVDACRELGERMQQAGQEWMVQSDKAAGLNVELMRVLRSYIQDLSTQLLARENERADLQQQVDALVDRVVEAQRGIDAVEEHKGKMKKAFEQLRASDAFKISDDQWSSLQAYKGTNGNLT